jgi:hypothetical protein
VCNLGLFLTRIRYIFCHCLIWNKNVNRKKGCDFSIFQIFSGTILKDKLITSNKALPLSNNLDFQYKAFGYLFGVMPSTLFK